MKEVHRHRDEGLWEVFLEDPTGINWVIDWHSRMLSVTMRTAEAHDDNDGFWFWIYLDDDWDEVCERAWNDSALFIMTECML